VPRPKIHDDELRVRLLDRAGQLLSIEGPSALNLRRLATDVGTSTTAVYTLFGGKPALLRALYVEALDRFGRRLATIPRTDDSEEDLLRLARAYRDCARADPHLYSIMFAAPSTDGDQDVAEPPATTNPLWDRIFDGLGRDLSLAASPEVVATCLWATIHGLLSLELTGHLPADLDIDAHFDGAVRAAIRGWGSTT